MKESLLPATLALLLLTLSFSVVAADEVTDEQLKAVLQQRIDKAKLSAGIVMGLIDEKGTRIVSYGTFSATDKQPVTADTVFEIGSVTKSFTGTLLSIMVERGEVKLNDPISKYLPATVKAPSRNGRQITLLDLATHTSGLPGLPTNLQIKDVNNPYKDYTVDELYSFLSGWKPTNDIGKDYNYSNLGMGLLGHILDLKAGTNYEGLVEKLICRPLAMTNTAITLSASMQARLAPGHSVGGALSSNWDIPTLAGAGALRSTVNDMSKFVSANLGLAASTLLPAMQNARQPRHAASSDKMDIGLAWHVTKDVGGGVVWHNGQTGGYHSFIGFDPKTRRGVVVLANCSLATEDLGYHFLDSKYELAEVRAAKKRVAITLEPAVLDRYIGRYQLAEGIFFNVRREDTKLMVQLTGQAYNEVFPESETDFFYQVVDAQLTFKPGEDGKTTSLVLHQNGLDQTAKKVSDEQPATPKVRKAIKLDAKIYDAYAGQYELAPGVLFTVRRDGDSLMVQLAGQSAFEVFPETETDFFYRIVDAQLTFVKNAAGEVTSLILHQNGVDQTAKRTK